MPKFLSGRTAAMCGVLAVGLLTAAGARAQDGPESLDTTYWLGRSASTSKQCPMIEWNVVPVRRGVAGPVKGVVFYHDMSGISRLSGSVTADGKITSSLTSVSGNGPVGTITGTRGPDSTHIDLHGTGCANASFTLQRWSTSAGGDN